MTIIMPNDVDRSEKSYSSDAIMMVKETLKLSSEKRVHRSLYRK